MCDAINRGIILITDNTRLTQWEALTGGSYSAFEKQMLSDLPIGSRLRTEYDGGGFFTIHITGAQRSGLKDPDHYFMFAITPGEHCKFIDAKVEMRGCNLAAKACRNVAEVLPAIGITSIDMFATYVGAYLWNRAGFLPFQSEWKRISPDIERRLDYLASVPGAGLSEDAIRHVRDVLNKPNPRGLWDIADRKEKIFSDTSFGKALILEWSPTYFGNTLLTEQSPAYLRPAASWRGKCDFTDEASRSRLMSYIGSSTPRTTNSLLQQMKPVYS